MTRLDRDRGSSPLFLAGPRPRARTRPLTAFKWDILGPVLALCLIGTCLGPVRAILVEEYRANLVIRADELVTQSFPGNHSHVDYFRLLQRDGDNLLIGARNFVYNISISDFSENKDNRIEWVSRKNDSDLCYDKGKSEAECHNYIRVLAKKSGKGQFLVCGTNAYKPTCRDYTITDDGRVSFEESSGLGRSPYDPRHNSTFVYADGELYAGTVVDFQGTIPLIFRDPLKTDHSDNRQLNVPHFVHSFEYGDFVFFFFRETGVEYSNCGKRVFSRVGRVCKSDLGVEESRASSMSTWTSFLKSRLNCSVPGQFPFYFDEIQSVSHVVSGTYGDARNDIIYAIFNTPDNSIPGSAVCSFSMRDVLDAFEGPFLEQKDRNSIWSRVPSRMVPDPRPGSCVNDSRSLPQEAINFVKSHPLMDGMVSSFLGQPILTKASFRYRFTKISVDPQVRTLAEGSVDVLFVATDVGVILKAINCPASLKHGGVSPIVIEEIHAFESPFSVNNLQIARPSDSGDPKLIIITDNEVTAINLDRCEKALSCRECVALQDPYCAWSPNHGVCGPVSKLGRDPSLLQNVSSGVHRLCPRDGEDNTVLGSTASRIYSTAPTVNPTKSVSNDCAPCSCSSTRPTPAPPAADGDLPDPVTFHSSASPLDRPDVHRSRHPELVSDPRPEQASSAAPPTDQAEPNHSEPPPTIAPRGGREFPRQRDRSFNDNGVNFPAPPNPNTSGRPGGRIQYSKGTPGASMVSGLSGPLIYSAETLAIAVSTACVAALVIGFISGFLFSRRCRGDHYPHLSDTPYLDSKLNKCDNVADPNMYTANNAAVSLAPPKQINNLVANYNPKNVNAGKAVTNTTANDQNLVKQAKCAYI